ncbi:hypothetical protein SDC9_129525 [bioreactor metagenome]|uniref:Uncharacterized protein n=1 Tax=bioreactor metagenome TaxID=1076179 RepID=A0A645CZS1_9ZZZZ
MDDFYLVGVDDGFAREAKLFDEFCLFAQSFVVCDAREYGVQRFYSRRARREDEHSSGPFEFGAVV